MELEAQLQAAQAALAEMKTERDGLKASFDALSVEAIDLRARIKGLEKAQKDAVVEKHVRAGRVTPAMRADVDLLAEHLTAEELDARLGKWSQVIRPVGTGTSQGAEEATEAKPLDMLNAKARELQATNPKMTFTDAFDQACRALPDAYRADRAANISVRSGAKKRGA